MRICSAAVFLVLAACSDTYFDADAVAEGDQSLECSIGEGSSFAGNCTLERETRDGSQIFIAHHPGGGFRRFALAADGGGLETLDGADMAQNRLADGTLEVSVGPDRYRFAARTTEGGGGE